MKITVEMSEKEVDEIRLFCDERKKGPAIRKLALESLALRKRKALLENVVSGKTSVDLPDWKTLRQDRDFSWT